MGMEKNVRLVAGSEATSPVKFEDGVHASGSAGMFVLGVVGPSTTGLAASANGDYAPFLLDPEGKVIISGTGIPIATRQSNVNLTTTSDVALLASAGTGQRHMVCDVTVENTGASAARFIMKDGSTVVWTCTVPAGSTFTKSWRQPIRGSQTTALNGALGAAGTVTVSVSTYTSPS